MTLDGEAGIAPKDSKIIPPVKTIISEGLQPKKETLSGEETSKVIAEMYEALGPTNGCLLVEPTAVLAVAGLKGSTFLTDPVIDQQEAEKINALNSLLASRGIELWYAPNYQKSPPTQFTINNLHGIARKSNRTTIPGVAPYDSTTGWPGHKEWRKHLWDNLKEAQKDGRIDPTADTQIYYEGIILGYPDQAIEDYQQWYKANGSQDDLVEADILSVNTYAEQYHGPTPEFDYYPSSANDAEIQETISAAREILDGFYKSEWHTKIAQDPNFLAAREAEKERNKKRIEQRTKSLSNQ